MWARKAYGAWLKRSNASGAKKKEQPEKKN
jgi:hypothetical protein